MEFAKKQLEKYGWKEGEGLGKSKNGMLKPLKVTLKLDKGGLGHYDYDDINNTWWKRLYDDAAKNIRTKTDSKDRVILETVSDSLHITTKRKKYENPPNQDSVYKNFVRKSESCKNIDVNIEKEKYIDEKFKETPRKCTVNEHVKYEVSDEELFRICEGRTAHKGARHGLQMNAKLARLEQQEALCTGKLVQKPDSLMKKKTKGKYKTKDN